MTAITSEGGDGSRRVKAVTLEGVAPRGRRGTAAVMRWIRTAGLPLSVMAALGCHGTSASSAPTVELAPPVATSEPGQEEPRRKTASSKPPPAPPYCPNLHRSWLTCDLDPTCSGNVGQTLKERECSRIVAMGFGVPRVPGATPCVLLDAIGMMGDVIEANDRAWAKDPLTLPELASAATEYRQALVEEVSITKMMLEALLQHDLYMLDMAQIRARKIEHKEDNATERIGNFCF